MFHTNLLLEIGATAPFSLLHISDTHLCRVNEEDDERKRRMAEHRQGVFPRAEENFAEIRRAAKEEGCPIVNTGDLMDFVSEENLKAVREFTENFDVFTAAGNHDFCQYVGVGKEDAEYRNQSLAKVNAAYGQDIRKSSRVINGVKLIALDNGYYLFEKEQLEFLKEECADGLPVILLLHTPLYTPALQRFMLTDRGQPCAYLCGTPEEEMRGYEAYRFEQQRADDLTRQTIAFIKGCPNIRCLLTGHNHVDVASYLRPDLPQYTVGLETVCHIRVR